MLNVAIVCGPPGSGKTTLVNDSKGNDDLVYDLDELGKALGNFDSYPRPKDVAELLLGFRDCLVVMVKQKRLQRKAWIIVESEAMATKLAEFYWQRCQ